MGFHRRSFLKASAFAATTAALSTKGGLLLAETGGASLALELAGYPYNHVKPLVDGLVEIEGCNTSFALDKIGKLNTHVFEGPQTRAVTEVGLAPFMLAYANDRFRDYSLLPVFTPTSTTARKPVPTSS